MWLGMGLDQREDLVHVIARRKIGAGAAQDHEADLLRFARNGAHVLAQRFEHVLRERIEFIGAIERQRRHTAAVFPSH